MSEQALFTLDLSRCTGCAACIVACNNENEVAEGLGWRQIHTFNETRIPGVGVHHLSLACNHCAEPACMYGCPTQAFSKQAGTGAVLLDADRCIGCGYCSWVCPYDAPQYDPRSGVMQKCTFCSHRLAEDLEPACVVACPVEALGFVSAGLPGLAPGVAGAERIEGFPDSGLGPGIRITRRAGSSAPAVAWQATDETDSHPRRPRFSAERLRSEWPLLLFSLGIALLVPLFAAGQLGGPSLHSWLVPLLGAAVLGVSGLHLGRPLRAWRALSNLRHSWVSREIAAVSAFWLSASLEGWLAGPPSWLGWMAMAFGVAGLIAIDRVYRVPGQRVAATYHSAMTSWTALLLLGLLLFDPWLVAAATGAKLLLWPWRIQVGELPLWLVLPRLACLVLAPIALWLAPAPVARPVALGLTLVGEGLDRARFYAELDFLTPRRQIELDLGQAG